MTEVAESTAVYVWGRDHSGQLGLGKKQEKAYCYPVLCTFQIEIAEVACGEEHSVIRTAEGTLYAMGNNADGRLGVNDRALPFSRTPVFLSSLSDSQIISVSCGSFHSGAVSSTGQLFTWGQGSAGALGSGTSLTHWKPHLVPNAADLSVVAVSCGGRHTAILVQDSNGTRRLLMCGACESGQLGLGMRDTQVFPRPLIFAENIQEVACGHAHTLFRTVSNRVFAMGANNEGQLGNGSKRTSLDPVHIGELDEQGVKQLACKSFSAAVTTSGSLFVWGTGSFGEFLVPQRLRLSGDIAEVKLGMGFGVVIDKRGASYSWGENSEGELGHGDFSDRPSPVQLAALRGKSIRQVACGGKHTIALCDDMPKTLKLSPVSQISSELSSPRSAPALNSPRSMVALTSPRNAPTLSSPRGAPEYQSSTKLMELYQAELDTRRRLEMALLKEQQEKGVFIKRVEAMAVEIRDLKEDLRKTKDDVSDREVDISRFSQKNLSLVEKNKMIAEKLREIPTLEQKVEELVVALADSEKAKRHLESALEASTNKCEDLTHSLSRVTQNLSESKETAKETEDNFHAVQRTLAVTRKELDRLTLEAEEVIQNLTQRQTDLETQWMRQLDEHVLKIEEQDDVIKELRRKLQGAGETVEQLQREVDGLKQSLAASNSDLDERNADIEELLAKVSHLEAKNKSLVEALEQEVKDRASSLCRAKDVLLPISPREPLTPAFSRTPDNT